MHCSASSQFLKYRVVGRPPYVNWFMAQLTLTMYACITSWYKHKSRR